jgi:hypothetical protein
VKPLLINMPAASGQLINTGGCLTLHASLETTGSAAATYRLWDGTSNASTGKLVLPVSLTAGQSTRDFFGLHIVKFTTGLYYELVSGSVQGNVAVMVDHDCEEIMRLYIESLTINL